MISDKARVIILTIIELCETYRKHGGINGGYALRLLLKIELDDLLALKALINSCQEPKPENGTPGRKISISKAHDGKAND